MRVSADRRDPGYRDDYRRWRVTFNGEERDDVITADTDQGLVYVTARDVGGDAIFDYVAYAFPTSCLRGEVALAELS